MENIFNIYISFKKEGELFMNQFQLGFTSGKSGLSIGFDTNILLDAIYKSIQGSPLSSLEENSLWQAKDFLESIVQFCNGTHKMSTAGISGGEAFSIYVNALEFEGTVEDIKKSALEHIKVLDELERGNTVNENEIGSIVDVFQSISKYLNNEVLSFTSSNIGGWRI